MAMDLPDSLWLLSEVPGWSVALKAWSEAQEKNRGHRSWLAGWVWGEPNLSLRPVILKVCTRQNPSDSLLLLECRFSGSKSESVVWVEPRNLHVEHSVYTCACDMWRNMQPTGSRAYKTRPRNPQAHNIQRYRYTPKAHAHTWPRSHQLHPKPSKQACLP